MSKDRVRFAPSPTGYLHIGGLRTCLLNYLYAKKTGSTLVLRIEDTDAARSTVENRNAIFTALKMMGVSWDEGPDVGGTYGPYMQSERTHLYKEMSEKLIKDGKAYRCFCTEEDLDRQRKEWSAKNPKVGFKYPGTCKTRTNEPDKPFVVRFCAPKDGVVEFTDRVFGTVKTPNIENQDFVIMRPDGLPLYNFGCVVDDGLMDISVVIRGADHLLNTTPQILLYNALGFKIPQFAHVGLMRSQSNEKLSKRHGSVSVAEFITEKGYSPQALISYIIRFGYGMTGDKELFTMQDLIDSFNLDRCIKADGKFDFKKLEAIQFAYIKDPTLTSDIRYAELLMPFVVAKLITISTEALSRLVPLVRSRSHTFVDAANELEPILRRDITIDPAAAEKFLTEENKQKLKNYTAFLSTINEWNEENLRTETQQWLEKSKLVLKDVGQPSRVALVGRTTSPELFQTMAAIGKTRTIERLQKAS